MADIKKYVSLDKLTKYDAKIKSYIGTKDAEVLASAKSYADGLATNYDAAGSAKTVQDNLDAEILRAKAAEEANATAAKQAQDEVNALELVVADKAAQSELDALESYVGTIPTVEGEETPATIVAYVQKKTSGIATSDNLAELSGRVTTVEGKVATIESDYLKVADKTELNDAIALKADQTALDAVSGVANAAATKVALEAEVNRAKGEEARIEGLVTAEAERAAGVESGLNERLVEVEAFFKLAEGEQLDTALDTLKEIQDYVTGEGAAADQMVLDIAANKKAIEDHIATDHGFAAADEALKTELNTEIAKKADKTTVEGIDGHLTTAEGKISANEQAIAALQTAIGDNGSVDTMIDNAVSAAIEAEEERVDGLLANKVDKVEGKGLSTNDLTNELKANYDAAYAHSQVAHAPADAQKNIIETVKVNGVALTVTDKAVDVAVPVNVSELTNDKGYLVASDIANKADKATTLAGYGITDAYTSAQTDTAIANAMAQFVEVSEEEINNLFA